MTQPVPAPSLPAQIPGQTPDAPAPKSSVPATAAPAAPAPAAPAEGGRVQEVPK
jgi:hypothetical protein